TPVRTPTAPAGRTIAVHDPPGPGPEARRVAAAVRTVGPEGGRAAPSGRAAEGVRAGPRGRAQEPLRGQGTLADRAHGRGRGGRAPARRVRGHSAHHGRRGRRLAAA